MTAINFKLRTTKIVKMKSGDEIIGKFLERKTREMPDKLKGSVTFGQMKEVPEFVFQAITEDGQPVDERFLMFGDSGLVNEIQNSGLKEGQICKIVKGDKLELDNGARSVNTYEIFVAE
jgi:hypothetical protein